MKEKSLILVGGGGHCKSVIDVAECAGFTITGILDLPEHLGNTVLGYPVIGTDNDISDFVNDALFLVTVGQIKDAGLRIKLHERIISEGACLATLIAPTAHVSKYASIAEGTVIMHHAVVNADACVGKGCIINTFANVEHDSIVDDFCHISTGVIINGNCSVGQGAFLGSHSVMVNGTSIMAGCVFAAGSVIRKNVIRKGVYSGNPAILKITL